MMEHARPLILIFARHAPAEVQEKRMHLPVRAGEKLFNGLNREILLKVKETGLPYVFWDESKQKGRHFGERIAHAVASVMDQGHRQVIIVGNDCPELTSEDIKAAAEKLSSGQIVVGPDRDGGAYLLAFSGEDFDHGRFSQLPWQEENFREEFLAQCKSDVFLLNTYYDLDRLPIIGQLRNKAGVSSVLRRLFSELFLLFTNVFTAPGRIYVPVFLPLNTPRRGPPFS